MNGLIPSHNFYLVLKLFTLDSSSSPFLSLIADEKTLIHLYFFLFTFLHLQYINNQPIFIIVTSMRVKSKKLFGLSVILGTGLAYYRINQINKILGTEILEYSLKALKEDLQMDNKTFNEDNSLHFFIEEVSNQIEITKRRFSVYLSRLINVGKYQKTCQQINKNVVNPLIRNYEAENIFQYADIIEEFKEKSQFNNKLSSVLKNIQHKNSMIKGQNKLLLERFYELQQQLLTAHIFDLKKQDMNKIDIVYSYFRQRERFASNFLKRQTKTEDLSNDDNISSKESWIDEINYGFKIQYL